MKQTSTTISLARLAIESENIVESMTQELEGPRREGPAEDLRWPTRFIPVGNKGAPPRWGIRFLAAGPKSAPSRS